MTVEKHLNGIVRCSGEGNPDSADALKYHDNRPLYPPHWRTADILAAAFDALDAEKVKAGKVAPFPALAKGI